MLRGVYKNIFDRLRSIIPEDRLYHDELRTLALGTDASFYRLIPKLVVVVESEEEVAHTIRTCAIYKTPLTFRAAGTSLSGQAISDSVLAILGDNWKKYQIVNDAANIRLQPGIIGGRANQLLLPYGKKIGPDPASINAAMIGGIAANNASGMCCGTKDNSYNTLAGMRVILSDGTLLDTNDAESTRRFRESHWKLLTDITELRREVFRQPGLAARISAKFKMKNTTGYSLNALVDHKDPVEILQHLMIGSEGTLGFIAEINYQTVPEYADKATALVLFPDTETACNAVSRLKSCPVEAVELMDRASLRSVEDKAGMPVYLRELDQSVTALLIETRAADSDSLQQNISEISGALAGFKLARDLEFTTDALEFARLWNIRKGLFPSVGAMRATGTTCIIEDVAFPVPRLAEATLELQQLFVKYGFDEAIIFGHALEGNLHFVFNQDFNHSDEVERYRHFMDDLTAMVVQKYDGSLKAEHGTGRNMAPFVEMEWGPQAYLMMRRIKEIFDPQGIFNPGVILNEDKQAHLKDLKPLPAAHEIVDKCIECGFCESKCVSAGLTLSPRQRITALREISRLEASGIEEFRRAALQDAYRYFGDETCATDGLCATACPVNIDTGKMIKDLRAQQVQKDNARLPKLIATHFGTVTRTGRALLNAVNGLQRILGNRVMETGARMLHSLSGKKLPLWNRWMPAGNKPVQVNATNPDGDAVVYFPTCITRAMGTAAGDTDQRPLTEVTIGLLKRAGYRVILPDNLDNLCCGMSFASKGYTEAGDAKLAELEKELMAASDYGNYPVLVDISPCYHRMAEGLDTRLKLFDPIDFTLEFLEKRLQFHKTDEPVAVHTVCSAQKAGLTDKLYQVVQLCSTNIQMLDTNCCGFAGDRGFSFPELNEHGLRTVKEQLPQGCHHGVSTSRTCEIGLSLHSGISFQSVFYLVDRVTQ